MSLKRLLICIFCCLAAASVAAQSETTPDVTATPTAAATPMQTATPLPVFPITPGSSIEGSITAARPVARYQFSADAGDIVSLRMEKTSGDLDPFLSVYGPDSELIQQDDDSGGNRNAEINLTLPRAGSYVAETGRYQQGGAASTGTFRLSLQIAGLTSSSPTDPLAQVPRFDLKPPPTLITYQETNGGTISDDADRVYFALGGRQGDLVRIIMTTASGDLTPRLDVLNGARVSIASSESQSGPVESVAYATLPETGWYLVEAGRRSGSGQFGLYAERVVAGNVLTPGDAVTGQFTTAAPTISYVFNARIGDLIAVNLFTSDEGSGIAPELRLLDASFQGVARASGSRFVTLQATIPRSGTYILQANNQYPSAQGGFNLRLTDVSVDVSKLSIDSISYNAQDRGFIKDNLSMRYYRFSGKAGERVTIEMNATSGSLDPYLILTDGNLNEELAFNDNVSSTRNARIFQYRLEKDGDYLILATRAGLAGGTSSGGYDLLITVGEVRLLPGALAATLTWNAGADLNLLVRDPSGRTLSWSNPHAPSGGTLQIDSNTHCETPTDQPVEHIYWPEQVNGDYQIWAWYQNPCGAADTPVSFALTVTSGERTILQAPANGAQLRPGQRFETTVRVTDDGAFALDSGSVTTPSAQQQASEGGDTLILYGDSASGTLDDSTYARFYQFAGAKGDRVTITAHVTSGTLDPILVLRDADNITLPGGTNDDADESTRDSRLNLTLPADGSYIIAVTRYGVRDGTTSGSFDLTLVPQKVN